MEHLAIDLGGKESQICVRSSEGQIVEERRCRTATLPAYLATRPHSRVIEKIPGGRMIQTGQFYHDYLGNPDMNMAYIAKTMSGSNSDSLRRTPFGRPVVPEV